MNNALQFANVQSSNSLESYLAFLKQEINARSMLHFHTTNSKTNEAIVQLMGIIWQLEAHLKNKSDIGILSFYETLKLKAPGDTAPKKPQKSQSEFNEMVKKCFRKVELETTEQVQEKRDQCVEIVALLYHKACELVVDLWQKEQLKK